MKICVLSSPDGWHFQDLKRAAGSEHDVQCMPFEQLSATLGGELAHSALEEFDCVLARAMPTGSLQQVVFRMDVLLELERKGLIVVNPPRSIEMCVDKYLALAKLAASNIPIPPTAVSQTAEQAHEQFMLLGGDVVMKPLFGSMGRGLVRISNFETAKSQFAIQIQEGNVIYQQAFIDHGGYDLRLFVIGERVLGMKRMNEKNWITNIAQGGVGMAHSPSKLEHDLAIRTARALGAEIAGIDLLYEQRTGLPMIVEANSAPAWQAISSVLKIDFAKLILMRLTELVKTRIMNSH